MNKILNCLANKAICVALVALGAMSASAAGIREDLKDDNGNVVGYKVTRLGISKDEAAVVFTKAGAEILWTVPADLENVQFLVVAGGGGGGGAANNGLSAGAGGGGGGAATEGEDGTGNVGGNGGEGIALDITGTMVVYGSGGGGGAVNSAATGAGVGGTGAGNGGFTTVATSALANQGGGGGGGGRTGNGGNGGSGIVVIRYTLEPEWTPPMPEKDGEADFKVEYNPEVFAALEAKTVTSVTVTVNGVKLKGDKAVEALNTAVKNFDDALTFDETAASLDIVVEVTEVNVENPAASKYVVKRGDTVLNLKEGATIKTSINRIDLNSDAVIFKLVIE